MKVRKEFINAHPEIAKKLASPEYEFLDKNEHLGNKIALLVLGGSYAYGLDVHSKEHESDVDIRGVAVNSEKEIIGICNFEQFENHETDTTIYGLKKFFNLLAACNPNIIEMLGARDEDYIYISPIGQLLLDNKHLFLSQRAANSFGGYANSQLRRIETATAKDRLPENIKRRHVAKSMESALKNLISAHNLEKYGNISFSVDKDTGEITISGNLENLPVGEWLDMMNATKQVKEEYRKSAGNRNTKKDDFHLNKHASHLIRLYKMGIEILRDKEINTYRGKDKDLLLAIKNGKYMDEEGLMTEAFYKMVDSLEADLEYWKENTSLPKSPDYAKIEDLLMKIHRSVLNSSGVLTRGENE